MDNTVTAWTKGLRSNTLGSQSCVFVMHTHVFVSCTLSNAFAGGAQPCTHVRIKKADDVICMSAMPVTQHAAWYVSWLVTMRLDHVRQKLVLQDAV